MKPILTHPSWSQIDKACAVLANVIMQHTKSSEFEPKAIIGLARGGLVPAVIISHILKLKMFPVSYSSKAGNGEYREYNNHLPEISAETLLIVDDIIDSGHTMKEVVEHYKSRAHNVLVASLYYKAGAATLPNFCWQNIPKDAPWIIFPWEVE